MCIVDHGQLFLKILIALEVLKLVGSLMDENDHLICEEQLSVQF